MVTGGSQRTGNGDARGWRTILGEAVEQRKWNEGVAMMVAVSKIRGVFSLSLSFRLSLCLSVSVSLSLSLSPVFVTNKSSQPGLGKETR